MVTLCAIIKDFSSSTKFVWDFGQGNGIEVIVGKNVIRKTLLHSSNGEFTYSMMTFGLLYLVDKILARVTISNFVQRRFFEQEFDLHGGMFTFEVRVPLLLIRVPQLQKVPR